MSLPGESFLRRSKTIAAIAVASGISFVGLAPSWATSFSFSSSELTVRDDASVLSDTGGVIELQLTPNARSKAGGFFSNSKLNLNQNFVLDGEIYLGSESDGVGADGIAFTLIPEIPSAVSSDGDGMGYSGLPDVFAIEWDTYHNSTKGDLGSEGDDLSMGLNKGESNHTFGSPYAPVKLIPRSTMIADNGTYRDFQIAWDAAEEEISVKYDLNGDSSFASSETIFDGVNVPMISTGGLFDSVGGEVLWGFTASTGLYVNEQKIRLSADALTITPATTTPYSGPIVTDIGGDGVGGPFEVSTGESVTVQGERLGSVSSVSIDGQSVTVGDATQTSFSFEMPADAESGLADLVVESTLGNLRFYDALLVIEAKAAVNVYDTVSAWTVNQDDGTAKVYVKFPTIGEKVRIGHQTGGSGSYETIYVKTTTSETMDGLRIVEGVGTYIVRTIDLESGTNRIRVTVGDSTEVQVRYNE